MTVLEDQPAEQAYTVGTMGGNGRPQVDKCTH